MQKSNNARLGMKHSKLLFFALLICSSFSVAAEEIYLNCIGTLEAVQVATNQKRNSQAQATFRIDLETNSFVMDGYPIMSTTLDPNTSTLRFLTTNSAFEFAHKFKNEKLDVLSTIKINRYSGKLEIYEALANANGMLVVTSNMDCTTAQKRKF